MPPAVIGGGLAAVGAIGGAVIGSKAQKSAANQANASQQAAMEAQLQLGRESMALNRDIYNSNYGILSPFVSRGNVAGNQINALLGLPNAPTMTSPLAVAASTGGGASAPTGYTGPSLSQIMAMQHDGIDGNFQPALEAYNRALSATPAPAPAQTPAQQRQAGRAARTAPANSTANSARAAFDQFANSAGMDFQMDLARNELQNLAGGGGWLQSGAAIKEADDRAQQMGINNYFLPYMNLLSGQQGVGAGAASAVAGVGSNFGNTAAGINGQMGGAIQGGANSASNAALARGLASSNMWSGIGSSFGNLAGSIFSGPTNNNLGGYDVNAYGGWS